MKKRFLFLSLVLVILFGLSFLKPVRIFNYVLFRELVYYFSPNRYYTTIEETEEEKKEMEFNIEEFVLDGNILDLIKTKYSNRQLERMNWTRASIYYFNNKYGIECLKKEFSDYNDKFYYVVYYMSTNKYLQVRFDEDGEFISSGVMKISKSKSYFENLTVGKEDKYDVVLEDRNGFYRWLGDFPSGPDVPINYSYHYTEDGYFVRIDYDNNGYIKDINIELI